MPRRRGFWAGAVPDHLGALPALRAAGVFGFKPFLVDSGVPEFPPLDREGLVAALAAVDALFVLHAEDPSTIRAAVPSRAYADFVGSRPPAAEEAAVSLVVDAARQTGARVHILHTPPPHDLPPQDPLDHEATAAISRRS